MHFYDSGTNQKYDKYSTQCIDYRRQVLFGFAWNDGNAYRPVPDYPYIQLIARACIADISNREYDEIVERIVQRLRGRLDKRLFGFGVRYITARRKRDFRGLYNGFRISRQMEI